MRGIMENGGKIRTRSRIFLLCVLFCLESMMNVNAAGGNGTIQHPRILFLSAYAYDWDSVPDQLDGVSQVLGTKAKMDYVFMDTKKHTYEEVKGKVRKQIQVNIEEQGQYNAVILEDDAALDFAMEYREDLFHGVPMVFEGINTQEKADLAHEDPLITGMVEFFPYYDTIALARKMYPKADKIVGISDNTESGKGCTERFYDEKAHFPELTFYDINASGMTEQEIKDTISSYDETTILVFLSLVNDGDGNTYSLLEATEFVAENANIPMFKCDYLGIGEGVFGGYVSSYEEMGRAAAQKVVKILEGTSPADIPVETMGGYPMFDQKMIDRFHVEKDLIPEDAVIVNYVPGFYETYRTVIWPAAVIIVVLILFFLVLILFSKKNAALRAAKIRDDAQEVYLKMVEEKNAQLSEAIIKAQKASRAKSDFLARMSHEIRTPMNAIIGETTLAQKNMDNVDKVKEYLHKIMISSRHLLNLINDVLDMSAIESDKIKIAKADFDIKEVVSTVTTLYYSQCRDKGIHFEAKLDHVLVEFLVGDQLRLQQIILNLLSNACKFTEPGGEILFAMSQEKQNETELNLHVMVRDTGCGMSEEYMSRIFRPFEQESSLTAKEHGGSGLGLSISKHLVELMGGKIQVESQVNVGTSFTLDIPFAIAEKQRKNNGEHLKQMKMMVIDDDEETLQYVAGILNHIGISYDCESNAQKALDKMVKCRNDQNPYNICLVDWKMKDQDGLMVTKKIRKAQSEDTIVVVVSAYDTNEIADKAKEAGVDACIEKPLFQSTLFSMLMNISEGKLVNKTAKPEDYDFTGKRVLLVDDTEMNRDIAKELLEMVGFQVDVAVDGEEGSECFINSPEGTYQVVLMDVQMPVMNGYEATEKIRKSDHPQAKSIYIIAMTANAFAEDIARSMEAGMNDHISKPIDTELLYEVLYRYLM